MPGSGWQQCASPEPQSVAQVVPSKPMQMQVALWKPMLSLGMHLESLVQSKHMQTLPAVSQESLVPSKPMQMVPAVSMQLLPCGKIDVSETY